MHDVSYGIIPLRRGESGWEVLLVHHCKGHWAFPKGHATENETPLETAARELWEETHLTILHSLPASPLSERYTFTHQQEAIIKTVHYFLALVEGEVVVQEEEIQAFQWFPLMEAEGRITFHEAKRVCREAIEWVVHHADGEVEKQES